MLSSWSAEEVIFKYPCDFINSEKKGMAELFTKACLIELHSESFLVGNDLS